MATYSDLAFEWSMLCQDCLDCWTDSDLQLAAELGKTLLERNKELETSLKQQQNIIEDQSQEIEYLTKQTAALREVNDSRLRIYEQLEVSIQDLERTNQRLAGENNSDKKKIKSLCVSIDGLESKCEELQRTLDEMQVAERQRRRRERRRLAVKEESTLRRVISMENGLYQKDDVNAADSMAEEEITNLLSQIQDLRRQKEREHQRVEELEEQMVSLVQENAALQEQLMVLRQREDQMKSLEEEVLALEEVRQGHLCARCLRSLDVPGDVSSLLESPDEEEMAVEEDISVHSRQDSKCPETMLGNQETLIEQSVEKSPHKSTTGNDENPYKVLVEKYEALLKMQRKSSRTRRRWKHGCKQGNIQSTLKEEDEDLNCLSLQEELKLSGDFSTNNDNLSDPASLIISNEAETILAEDTEVGNIDGTKDDYSKANDVDTMARNTPTTPTTDGGHDFSETETSSSGFSEEIRCMNKTTQTEECIVLERCETSELAGEENSYKMNANSVDGRFKNAPEYKHLFQEIFAVLKRSRSLSNEDLTEKENVENVPHKDPDLQSSPCTENRKMSEERVATPFKKVDNRVPLQNVPSNAVEITRKTVSYSAALQNARNVNKSSPDSKNGKQSANQSARKQRKSSNFKGSKVEFNINQDKFCVSEKVQKVQQWNFRPFASSASAEVAKLKQLEKSYAEVLRYGLSKQRQRLGQRK